MRLLLVTLALILFGLAAPTPARAQPDCVTAFTIESLGMCVQHAANEGHIDNQGIAHSLIAKLDAAQAASNREQNATAVNILQAFIRELGAQAGQHVDVVHAAHLQDHAQRVIQKLIA